ncbi:MAG: hypothetical protein DMG06_22215 [Acidobacteria bacterium]|nr:MAG: hypothetical protein DMG06_22215 [Acidobacteriota bacterium]
MALGSSRYSNDGGRLDGPVTVKKKIMVSLLMFWIGLAGGVVYGQKDKIIPRVDSNLFDRATFQADYDLVWQIVVNVLSEYQFQFARKDKAAGQIETGYIVLSRHPRFSKLSNGVKAFGNPPRVFLKKWQDGRIKIFAALHRLPDSYTQVIIRPEIEGFASFRLDDTAITGEWRPCKSNGKFEFEFLNEVATELKKKQAAMPATANSSVSNVPADGSKSQENEKEGTSNLFLSIPEGAEVYLNNKLIGMTPSRVSISAGQYKVVFRKPGYKDYQREFMLYGGSDVTVATELETK